MKENIKRILVLFGCILIIVLLIIKLEDIFQQSSQSCHHNASSVNITLIKYCIDYNPDQICDYYDFPNTKCYHHCKKNNITQYPILSTCNISDLGCIQYIETKCKSDWKTKCKGATQINTTSW